MPIMVIAGAQDRRPAGIPNHNLATSAMPQRNSRAVRADARANATPARRGLTASARLLRPFERRKGDDAQARPGALDEDAPRIADAVAPGGLRLAARGGGGVALDSRLGGRMVETAMGGTAIGRDAGSETATAGRARRTVDRIGRTIVAVLLAAAASLALAGAPALAQGAVKSKHGDWEMRCETPPGATREQCALLQSVAAEDRPNVNLVVIVLKTADGKSRLLRVVAPLGVLLPSGLGLKIDQTDIGRAGFVRCLPTGCVAEVVMEDKLLEQMKTSTTATFIIFQTPEEGVGIPLALAGFKDGFEKLP